MLVKNKVDLRLRVTSFINVREVSFWIKRLSVSDQLDLCGLYGKASDPFVVFTKYKPKIGYLNINIKFA